MFYKRSIYREFSNNSLIKLLFYFSDLRGCLLEGGRLLKGGRLLDGGRLLKKIQRPHQED